MNGIRPYSFSLESYDQDLQSVQAGPAQALQVRAYLPNRAHKNECAASDHTRRKVRTLSH